MGEGTQESGVPKNVPPRHAMLLSAPHHVFSGFLEFIREHGVAGFAIGFILGGAAQKLVQSLMDDIVNPLVGLVSNRFETFSEYTVNGFKVGDFLMAILNFLILCFVIFLVFKLLHLEKLDKPKE